MDNVCPTPTARMQVERTASWARLPCINAELESQVLQNVSGRHGSSATSVPRSRRSGSELLCHDFPIERQGGAGARYRC